MSRTFERLPLDVNACRDTHQSAFYSKVMNALPFDLGSMSRDQKIVDPFARNCGLGGKFTNDIDPNTLAHHHMDAIEFIRHCYSLHFTFKFMMFDPPFSERQSDEKYEGNLNIYSTPGYVKEFFEVAIHLIEHGGYVLKFGYNSNRPHPALDLVQGWIVPCGGNRNDVIVSLWIKRQSTII